MKQKNEESNNSDFLEDEVFGYELNKWMVSISLRSKEDYVNLKRIEELKLSKAKDFDTTKLVRLCEALNDNWKKVISTLLV